MSDESSKPSEKEQLIQVLTTCLESGDALRSSHQQEILTNLSETFKDDLAAYLKEYQDQGLSAEKIRGRAAGFIFETLVRADKRIFGELETPAAVELRQVLHKHRQYGFDDPLLDAREPDITIVKDDGSIAGYGEAKLTLLDDRSRHQLAVSGAKATFLRVTRYLRENYEKLEGWGLPALAAKNKKDIAVSKDGFERVLVVPFDRDTANPENLISRRADSGLDEDGYQDLKNILKTEIRIVKSPFDLKEVWSITDALLEEIT